MTQDEIIDKDEVLKMAVQAGFTERNVSLTGNTVFVSSPSDLVAFAKLVDAKATAREREACAKLMQSMRPDLGQDNPYAKAIQARGQHE
jgi:hypothetical protein